jgi:hypothetical protein
MACRGSWRERPHHKVHVEVIPSFNVGHDQLSKAPRHPVTLHRIPNIPADREGEPRPPRTLGCEAMHHEQPTTGAFSRTDDRRNLPSVTHPARRRQHVGSDRDGVAALATPRGENGPASTRPHPQPETVLLVPSSVVRLVSALGHARKLLKSQPARRRRGQ